jgi:hypothetical protein
VFVSGYLRFMVAFIQVMVSCTGAKVAHWHWRAVDFLSNTKIVRGLFYRKNVQKYQFIYKTCSGKVYTKSFYSINSVFCSCCSISNECDLLP